jgi:hypothetical protein
VRVRLWIGIGMAAGAYALAWSSVAGAAVGSHPVPTYQTNGRVNTIVVTASRIYIGGKFTSVRPAGAGAGTNEVTRNRVAAFDKGTGALLAWNPNANGTVRAIQPVGSTVYLGGAFTAVGGKTRNRLAAVDAATGAPTAWKPTADSEVFGLDYAAGILYVGGGFANVSGSSRQHLAAFTTATGALSSWTPSPDGQVKALALTADGSKVMVGGDFTHVNGAAQDHIAALSPSSGGTLPWSDHVGAPVIALQTDANGVYTAVGGAGGSFAAFDPATGHRNWDGGTDGNVTAVSAVGGTVYFGGHYNNYCGPGHGYHTCPTSTTRRHILAVDESTGALQSWNPGANSSLGVFALRGDPATGDLFAGGDFTKIGGANQQGLAEFTPGAGAPGADVTPPNISCDAADSIWHVDDVTITCTATDSGSGLVNPADASFSLVTSVAAGKETANAMTDSRQICDVDGNCAPAGPVGGNQVDKKPPTVTCDTLDTAWHPSNISPACSAADGGSGVASPSTFDLTTSVPAGTETAGASTDSHLFCDGVDNCTQAGPYLGIKIDLKPPQNPGTVKSTDHKIRTWSRDRRITMKWTSATDGGSRVDGFSFSWNHRSASTPDKTKDAEQGARKATSPRLKTGKWWFHLRTRDNVGNWSSAVTRGPYFIDVNRPRARALSASGKVGYELKLEYRTADNTHRTRERITVSRGGRVVSSWKKGMGSAFWNTTQYASWTPHSAGSYSFCVKAFDPAGNSRRDCAGISVHP